MDASTILSVIGAAATGFAASLISIPIQAKTANSKALKTLEEVYGGIIKTLKTDLSDLTKKVNELEKYRCERKVCSKRIPPKNEEYGKLTGTNDRTL